MNINDLVQGYTSGRVAEADMAAWLEEVYRHGLSFTETLEMTQAMVDSGKTVDLTDLGPYTADKHSTGGVGDKTTLIVAPLAAACGLKFAKMSGRRLGHTGGTLDKLESIPGFKISLSPNRFAAQVERVGAAIVGQTAKLAPADKKIYDLRDRTGTIASIPLIASSVMSKKIAAGAKNIVLDIKTGRGAFMKQFDDARELAETCVNIGKAFDRNIAALITGMDRPLGRAVGTALETAEAIDVLRGGGPSDTKELSLELTASLIRLSGLAKTERQALSLAESRVADGEALTIFNRMIEAQGAEPGITEPGAIPLPDESASVKAAKAGMITAMDTEEIGWALKDVAGAIFEKKTGDRVVAGEVLFRTYGDPGETAADRVAKAITIGPGPVSPTPLIIAYL